MPNLNGQEKNLELENSELIEEFTINCNLPKGIYLLEISSKNFREIKRLMLK